MLSEEGFHNVLSVQLFLGEIILLFWRDYTRGRLSQFCKYKEVWLIIRIRELLLLMNILMGMSRLSLKTRRALGGWKRCFLISVPMEEARSVKYDAFCPSADSVKIQ